MRKSVSIPGKSLGKRSSLNDEAHLTCDIFGFEAKKATARILTQEVHAFNDFKNEEQVKIEEFNANQASAWKISLQMPF